VFCFIVVIQYAQTKSRLNKVINDEVPKKNPLVGMMANAGWAILPQHA